LLPVAVAEDGDAGFDFDEAIFRWRQMNSARKEKGGQGLHVASAQPGMGREG